MNWKALTLILIIVLLSSLGSYSLYRNMSAKKLPDLVNQKKEEENKPNFENEKKAESKKEELIANVDKVNNETELVEINGWLDYFFIIFCTLIIDYLFYRDIKRHVSGLEHIPSILYTKIKQSGQFFAKVSAYCLTKRQMKKIFRLVYQNLKTTVLDDDPRDFYEEHCQKDFAKFKTNLQNWNVHEYLRIAELLLYDDYLKDNDFFVSAAVFTILYSSFEQRLTIWFFLVLTFIYLIIIDFISCFYFVFKSWCQVGFRKTLHNFTWMDLFSIYKVFRHNSWFKKILFGGVLGLRIFGYWHFIYRNFYWDMNKTSFGDEVFGRFKEFNVEDARSKYDDNKIKAFLDRTREIS